MQRIIQDSAYNAEVVLGFLNNGILDVASWDNLDSQAGMIGTILLPELESNEEVVTDVDNPFVDLPSTYHKNLYQVTCNEQPSPIVILPNRKALLERWDGDLSHSGPVQDVAIAGSNLFYQPIPEEAINLTLWFYARPTLLIKHDPEDADDIPTCIPLEFHRDLLVNYAVKEIYDEIEDGIDGQKVNTKRYEGKYQQALAKFYQSIKHKSKEVPYIRRHAHFF